MPFNISRNVRGAIYASLGYAYAMFVATTSAVSAATTCNTVAACVFAQNTDSSVGSGKSTGIEGTSKSGDGVVGYTYYKSTSAATGKAGVSGYDATTNTVGWNSGVYGTSAYGSGVQGKSAHGFGVTGQGGSESYGVVGVVGGSKSALFGAGIWALAGGGATDGLDVQLTSPDTGSAISVEVDTSPDGGGDVFDAQTCGIGCQNVASIDNSGDLTLGGSLTQEGTPFLRTRSASGRRVVAFGSRLTQPSVEDTGEAQLVRGEAYVKLEPAFAETIDRGAKYLVFVTPQGDSHGLYVSRLSSEGFAVFENDHGRSTLAFDYRIVAKPYDTKAMRLPEVDRLPHPRLRPRRSALAVARAAASR